jgi:hypothetical protein
MQAARKLDVFATSTGLRVCCSIYISSTTRDRPCYGQTKRPTTNSFASRQLRNNPLRNYSFRLFASRDRLSGERRCVDQSQTLTIDLLLSSRHNRSYKAALDPRFVPHTKSRTPERIRWRTCTRDIRFCRNVLGGGVAHVSRFSQVHHHACRYRRCTECFV